MFNSNYDSISHRFEMFDVEKYRNLEIGQGSLTVTETGTIG